MNLHTFFSLCSYKQNYKPRLFSWSKLSQRYTFVNNHFLIVSSYKVPSIQGFAPPSFWVCMTLLQTFLLNEDRLLFFLNFVIKLFVIMNLIFQGKTVMKTQSTVRRILAHQLQLVLTSPEASIASVLSTSPGMTAERVSLCDFVSIPTSLEVKLV